MESHCRSGTYLILANRAIPSSNRLVLAHHDVLRDLIKQPVSGSQLCISFTVLNFGTSDQSVSGLPKIMRNHYNTALKSVDCVR